MEALGGASSCRASSQLELLRRYARPGLSPASVVGDTAVADRNTAYWTHNRVCVTPRIATALSASKRDSTTFNRVLAGGVHFRHNGEIAEELLGWHGGKLYA